MAAFATIGSMSDEPVVSPAVFWKTCLQAVALAAIEVYRRECLGLLVGYRHDDCFEVTLATSYQSAVRRFRGSSARPRAHKRLMEAISELPTGLELLGDFHSHPQYGDRQGVPQPSDRDIEDMVPGLVHLVVAINDGVKTRGLQAHSNGTLSAGIGRYELLFGAWTLTQEAPPGEPRRPRNVPLSFSLPARVESGS